MTKVRIDCLKEDFKNMNLSMSQVHYVLTYIRQIVITVTKLLTQPEIFLDGFDINLKEMKLNKI